MKKSELIAKLQAIEGDPTVLLEQLSLTDEDAPRYFYYDEAIYVGNPHGSDWNLEVYQRRNEPVIIISAERA